MKVAIKAIAGVLAGVFVAAGSALARPMTDQEKLMTEYLATRGIHRFVMLNEKRGQIMTVDKGAIVSTASALSGRTPGDVHTSESSVTPAGVFQIAPSADQTHPEATLSFQNMQDYNLVIHHVIDVRGQKRRERLASSDPAQKRISSGCINLSAADYRAVSRFVTQGEKQTVRDADGTPSISAHFLVILPESNDPAATRRFFNIPPTIRP